MEGPDCSTPRKSIVILLFLIPFITYSQYYQGLDIGLNTTTAEFNIDGSVNSGRVTGFLIGYVYERDISDMVFLRLGLTFNRRAFNVNTIRGVTIYNEKYGSDAIEIPVNLGYYLNWNRRNFQFFVDAGFNIGYNNRAIVKKENETVALDIGKDADIKRTAFGANGSMGLLIKKRLKVRLNYYYGLSNMANTDNYIWKNRTLSISLNYFLREKEVD